MPRPTPCGCSSPITSRRAPPSSPTAGSPTARPPRVATSTSGSPAPAGRRTRRCPGVHRVASLATRWLLGTHQGSADDAHLPSYLDEFVFRFNRRRSRSRGLVFYRVLELAVAHQPVRYRDLVLHPRTPKGPRQPPGTRGKPPTLDRPPARRPWRSTDQHNSGYRCLTVEVTRWTQSRAGSYRSETPRATAWRTPPLSAAVRNIRS